MILNKLATTRLMFLISGIIIMLFLAACEVVEEEEKLLIVTTIYPYQALVNQLVGDDVDNVEVLSLLSADQSPHTYSPTPEDVMRLEDADLLFSNGADLEVFLDNALNGISDTHISAYPLVRDMLPDVEENNHHPSCSHSLNPHFWLDPILVMSIADEITEALTVLDPPNKGIYVENLETLKEELTSLHERISRERDELGEMNVLYFHDAFYYFNKRYDIHSAGVIVPSPGKEPTAAELARIGKKIKEHDINVIFTEPQLNPQPAKVIANEFDLYVDTVDPLGNEEIAPTIGDLILYNWVTISRYFQQ